MTGNNTHTHTATYTSACGPSQGGAGGFQRFFETFVVSKHNLKFIDFFYLSDFVGQHCLWLCVVYFFFPFLRLFVFCWHFPCRAFISHAVPCRQFLCRGLPHVFSVPSFSMPWPCHVYMCQTQACRAMLESSVPACPCHARPILNEGVGVDRLIHSSVCVYHNPSICW